MIHWIKRYWFYTFDPVTCEDQRLLYRAHRKRLRYEAWRRPYVAIKGLFKRSKDSDRR